jgi:hypothetical protein
MMLKGRLTHSLSLERLKDKYSHNLPKTWRRFKRAFPGEDLSEYDAIIEGLDRFESLRYPDSVLMHGAHIHMCVPPNPDPVFAPITGQPVYQLSLGDMDRLMARLFALCRLNGKEFVQGMTEQARKLLLEQNACAEAWFPPDLVPETPPAATS